MLTTVGSFLQGLSSGVRWGFLALFITFLLLLFEGSGMLSRFTEGHPKIRKAMAIAFWILLVITIFLIIFWNIHPTIDTTAGRLDNIQNTLNSILNKLDDIEEALENLK
jgi:predicted PurR-regulated permease PerM